MRRAILAFMFLVLFFRSGFSQLPQDQWEGLKTLTAGQNLRVVDTTFQKADGRFVEVSEEYLKYRTKDKELTLERGQVVMVSVPLGPSKGKRVLLGILWGALIGFRAWAKMNDCEKYGCWDETTGWYEGNGKGLPGRSAAVATGVGAGVMGLLAAFSDQSYRVIYVHNPAIPYYEAPMKTDLEPPLAMEPDGIAGPIEFPELSSR